MGQVSVTLNGRTYRLECGEGEETHLIALAEYLGSHVDTMRRKFGQVGDDRLILMASLRRHRRVVGAAAADAGDENDAGRSAPRPVGRRRIGEVRARPISPPRVSAAADRLEMLNERFARSEPDSDRSSSASVPSMRSRFDRFLPL